MEQGFFLDGIDIHGDDLAIDKAIERAVPVLANSAYAPMAVMDQAVVAAEVTQHVRAFTPLICQCLFHDSIIAGKMEV
jgi:hypothetical protein